MIANQILIFGVGRSGTTAIYNLLQDILLDNYSDDVDFVYEPFFWNRHTFNKRYSDYKDDFTKTSSLSLEGIITDRTVPLFMGEKFDNQIIEHDYLRSIVEPFSKKNVLTKFIRANGRISLFRKIAPKAKVLFVIRNPLDVVNSAINMFDFFGGDFLPSDLDRFKKEVKKTPMYNKEITFGSREENTFAYWYYMNRHFVDYYQSDPQSIMPIIYEDYISNKEFSIRAICEFIGVKFKDSYVKASQVKVGKITKISPFTQAGYDYFKSKVDLYTDLTSELGHTINSSLFLEKYTGLLFDVNKVDTYEVKNTLFLKNEIEKRDAVIAKKNKDVAEQVALVKYKQTEIEKRDAVIVKKNKDIKQQIDLINDYKKIVLVLEKFISLNPYIHLKKKIMTYRKLASMLEALRNNESRDEL